MDYRQFRGLGPRPLDIGIDITDPVPRPGGGGPIATNTSGGGGGGGGNPITTNISNTAAGSPVKPVNSYTSLKSSNVSANTTNTSRNSSGSAKSIGSSKNKTYKPDDIPDFKSVSLDWRSVRTMSGPQRSQALGSNKGVGYGMSNAAPGVQVKLGTKIVNPGTGGEGRSTSFRFGLSSILNNARMNNYGGRPPTANRWRGD